MGGGDADEWEECIADSLEVSEFLIVASVLIISIIPEKRKSEEADD